MGSKSLSEMGTRSGFSSRSVRQSPGIKALLHVGIAPIFPLTLLSSMWPVRATIASCTAAIFSWFATKNFHGGTSANATAEAGFDDLTEDKDFLCDPCPSPTDPGDKFCHDVLAIVNDLEIAPDFGIPEEFCDLLETIEDKPIMIRIALLVAALAFSVLAVIDFAHPLNTMEDFFTRLTLNKVLHGLGVAIVTALAGPRQWPTIYVVLTIAEGRFLAAGFCLTLWAAINMLF